MMTPETKEALVRQFLRGESVTDISAFHAVTRTIVEDVLRESITGLAALNKMLYRESQILTQTERHPDDIGAAVTSDTELIAREG